MQNAKVKSLITCKPSFKETISFSMHKIYSVLLIPPVLPNINIIKISETIKEFISMIPQHIVYSFIARIESLNKLILFSVCNGFRLL